MMKWFDTKKVKADPNGSKIKSKFFCPRCNKPLHQWIPYVNFLWGGLFPGIVYLFFSQAKTKFICEECRIIEKKEFPPEIQQEIEDYRLLRVCYGVIAIVAFIMFAIIIIKII